MKGLSIDDPEMNSFKEQTDRVNALAEASKGFIWRDTGSYDTEESKGLFDDQVLTNMSVWESIEALKAFTYKTFHTAIMKRQKEWFQKYGAAHYALWWIEAGHIPTLDEGARRLRYLDTNGASEEAFTFKEVYENPK